MIQLPAVADRITQNALRLISDYLRRVLRSEIVTVTSNATADVPFIVTHTLGVVPKLAVALSEADGAVYATADDKNEWTARQVKLRCTSANTQLIVEIKA